MKLHKVFLLSLLLSSALVTSTAFGQARPSNKTNALTLDLGGLFDGFLPLQYEWKTAVTNSFAVRLNLVPSDRNQSAFGLGATYRFFVIDSRALTGFSVGPALDFLVFRTTFGDSYNVMYIGGDAAYKWIFDSFVVEPDLKVRFLFGESLSGRSGLHPYIGVNLGYAW